MQILTFQTPIAVAPAEVIDFRRACEMLGVSVRTAERMLEDPLADFPRPFRIGRRRFYRPGDLATWVKGKAEAATGANPRPATGEVTAGQAA